MMYYLMQSPLYEVLCLVSAIIGVTMFGIHKAWRWAWNRATKGKTPQYKSMWD